MGLIQFETNVPQELALKFDEGRETETKYGKRVLFTLVGEDRMIVSPDVAEKIKKAGIGKMELFRICKREVRNGKKSIDWEITLLGDAAEPPAPESKPQPKSSLPPKPAAPQPKEQARRGVSEPSRTSAPQAPASGNQNATQNHGTAISATGHTGLSMLLGGCLIATIDAYVVARDYAVAKNVPFAFTEASIQDLATSLLIHCQRMMELECKFMDKAAVAIERVQNGGGVNWLRQ